MKKVLLGLILLTASNSFAIGSEGVGGGDLCEARIKVIREDIKSWIIGGGPSSLQLPEGVTVEAYSTLMLNAINETKIKCVGKGDPGYPVLVKGTPKTCRFDKTRDFSQITCSYDKFQQVEQSNQYILIHHEFAGVAGLEEPSVDGSTYDISNQISGYLVSEAVKKLAIKPNLKTCQLYRNREALMGETPPIGTKCKSRTGVIWERVLKNYFGKSWKSEDGTIWSSLIGRSTQEEGRITCANFGGTLPTRANVEAARANGFDDIDSRMTFWTASESVHNPNLFYAYFPFGREFQSYPPTDINEVYCIAK